MYYTGRTEGRPIAVRPDREKQMNRKTNATKFQVGQTFQTKSGRRYRVNYVEQRGATEYVHGEYLDSPYSDEDPWKVASFGSFRSTEVTPSYED